jgi:predicted DNA-binding WGR domain protein
VGRAQQPRRQAAGVVDLAKQMQAEATVAAKISTFTKKLSLGKVPSPSEMEAYAALDDTAKVKAIQAAVKKSGHKLQLEKINALLDQGAAKAGIEMVAAPAPKPVHFGQQHEGQVLGVPGTQAKFKFEDGQWDYWTGESWNQVKAAEWLTALEAGENPVLKKPLQVVADPGGNFGPANEGTEFDMDAPYTVKFEGGEWLFKYKDTKGGQQGEWHSIANDQMVEALNAGKQYGGNGATDQPLVPILPQPDSSVWGYSPSDPGMSGNPTLSFNAPDGTFWQVVALEPMDGVGYQVFKFDESNDGGEPDHKDIPSAERVQSYLQKQGLHPPDLNTILKLTEENEPGTGPTEGATKQGVGGVLTLKDGHWTLDNAATVSFFSQHAIQPASPLATAVVQMLQQAASAKDASVVMSTLVKVKETAKTSGYVPAQVNDLIEDLNGVYSTVLAQQLEAQTEAEETVDPIVSSFTYEHLLHNTTEGHSKFWKVSVDPKKSTATTTWGKIGAAKPQSKTYKHASPAAAYQAAKDAAHAKLGKGYQTKELQDSALTVESAKASYAASTKSFGKENEGKVFSSVMSTGATGFYKYEGGQWLFSFDPNSDGWDPIPKESALNDNLEQGLATNKSPLLDLGKQSFGAANAGKMFESTLSTGKQVVFKFENGQWHNRKVDDDGKVVWVPNVSSHWVAALDQGVDVNGQPLVEVASFNLGGSSFGADGTVYTSKMSPGLLIFKKLVYGDWAYSSDGGGQWIPINPDTQLGAALAKGEDVEGNPLLLHDEDAYGNPQTAAVADDGPHEGDIKPGKDGWLILKNGHWVKASLEEAIVKLCPVPQSITSGPLKSTLAELAQTTVLGKPIQKRWKKVATSKNGLPNVNLTIASFGAFGNFGGKWVGYAKKTDLGKAGKWEGVVGSSGKNVAAALNWLEHAAKVQDAFLTKKAIAPESPFAAEASPQAAPAPAPAPKPVAAAGAEAIDGWAKTGGQGGFNEGGTYKDPDGDEWYCKFPAGGAKVARNELLANKLYDAAGVPVPEVKLVSQGGKIGIASRIVKGAVQDKAALEAGKGEGLLSGFVADAWLANWDVVGNNPAAGKGWDNIMFLNGKAVRIDPGGALLYGGAGGKKTAFSAEVVELDTMRDPKVNARTAKVFGKISQADLQASAEKVLSIPDSAIEQMVQEHGPGDATEKAALAKTLLARKAHLESKFPKVAAKVKKAASDGRRPARRRRRRRSWIRARCR